MIIQSILEDDVMDCYRIEQKCFRVNEMFQIREIKDLIFGSFIRLKAVEDDKIVGYALARHANYIGYLYSSAVLPEYRGRGIGRELIKKRVHYLYSKGSIAIQAHTNVRNIESASLLYKEGFRAIQYIPDFYGENEDGTLWEQRI